MRSPQVLPSAIDLQAQVMLVIAGKTSLSSQRDFDINSQGSLWVAGSYPPSIGIRHFLLLCALRARGCISQAAYWGLVGENRCTTSRSSLYWLLLSTSRFLRRFDGHPPKRATLPRCVLPQELALAKQILVLDMVKTLFNQTG